jgi:hypothetical protein
MPVTMPADVCTVQMSERAVDPIDKSSVMKLADKPVINQIVDFEFSDVDVVPRHDCLHVSQPLK